MSHRASSKIFSGGKSSQECTTEYTRYNIIITTNQRVIFTTLQRLGKAFEKMVNMKSIVKRERCQYYQFKKASIGFLLQHIHSIATDGTADIKREESRKCTFRTVSYSSSEESSSRKTQKFGIYFTFIRSVQILHPQLNLITYLRKLFIHISITLAIF